MFVKTQEKTFWDNSGEIVSFLHIKFGSPFLEVTQEFEYEPWHDVYRLHKPSVK